MLGVLDSFNYRNSTWGASICLFQHHLKEELVIGNGPSFISSNASKLTTWLLDVNVSGKSAGLRLTDSGNTSQCGHWRLRLMNPSFAVFSQLPCKPICFLIRPHNWSLRQHRIWQMQKCWPYPWKSYPIHPAWMWAFQMVSCCQIHWAQKNELIWLLVVSRRWTRWVQVWRIRVLRRGFPLSLWHIMAKLANSST